MWFSPEPDEEMPQPAHGPAQVSSLIGGGYSCLRTHQGVSHVGTFGCVVARSGAYFALTSRHIAGMPDEEIRAFIRGEYHRVGKGAGVGVDRVLMSDIFRNWPAGERTYLNMDAGLVRIDDFYDWTSQVFGIGEIGPVFNATEQAITLDLIDSPVRAFGGTSGVMEGAIRALFFRYESLGVYDHATRCVDWAAQIAGPAEIGRPIHQARRFRNDLVLRSSKRRSATRAARSTTAADCDAVGRPAIS